MTRKRSTTKRADDRALEERIRWWKEARFGLFIHWGLYAVPAGIWKRKKIDGIGEWIMHRAKIPVDVYSRLAAKFNPVKFNATEWVRIARDAGMKYIVITSKHHDGFALFDSPSSPYNIVNATPYGSDPIKDLARACHRAGIKLCFYYSQTQDWHEPDAAGNTWDFPNESKKDFKAYLENKVKPQLRELLTQYGPIGLIWFDTPQRMTRAESLDLKKFVHSIQPDCLVSGRVGNGLGDYGSLGDNQIPAGRVTGYWETPATMNDTWGYKTTDHNWKSVKTLLRLLIDCSSKGVNYLLNVGPTAEGLIPRPSVNRLRDIGKWLQVNGEAIYGANPNPYPYDFDWGRITWRPGKLYLHVYNWPRKKLVLQGLRSSVAGARISGSRRKSLAFTQTTSGRGKSRNDILEIYLPGKRPSSPVPVVVLDIKGKPRVDENPLQSLKGDIYLPAFMGHLKTTGSKQTDIDASGAVAGWQTTDTSISWDFKVAMPGDFDVQVITSGRHSSWHGNHKVTVKLPSGSFSGTIRPDIPIKTERSLYFPEAATRMGNTSFSKAGTYSISVKADQIDPGASAGFRLMAVRLVPVKAGKRSVARK